MTKPVLKNVDKLPEQSFLYKNEFFDFFPAPWHYHPEYEIIYVVESTGIRIIGDHIAGFGPGDLVIIGSGIPHIYISDKKYKEKIRRGVHGIAIQFEKEFAGKDFMELPEMKPVKKLIEVAKQGVIIRGQNNQTIQKAILGMDLQGPADRLISLLNILKAISVNELNEIIEGETFQVSTNMSEIDRFNKVLSYITSNFREQISLETAANQVNMNINSFCRYFKQRTGKTLSQYVNNIRIAYACELLIENDYNVAQICYESGYNNISHFNRKFRQIKGCSPLNYKKNFFKHLDNN